MLAAPALAFANTIAQSDAPAVAYATVYPLVMFLRIIIAQLLILFFMSAVNLKTLKKRNKIK